MFARRALSAIKDDKLLADVEPRAPLAISFGVATFPEGRRDFDELVHRCRARMDEGRLSLHRRLMLEELDFWSTVDLLLGTSRSPSCPSTIAAARADVRRCRMRSSTARRWRRVRELERDPSARGLLYVGVPEVRATCRC